MVLQIRMHKNKHAFSAVRIQNSICLEDSGFDTWNVPTSRL